MDELILSVKANDLLFEEFQYLSPSGFIPSSVACLESPPLFLPIRKLLNH